MTQLDEELEVAAILLQFYLVLVLVAVGLVAVYRYYGAQFHEIVRLVRDGRCGYLQL